MCKSGYKVDNRKNRDSGNPAKRRKLNPPKEHQRPGRDRKSRQKDLSTPVGRKPEVKKQQGCATKIERSKSQIRDKPQVSSMKTKDDLVRIRLSRNKVKEFIKLPIFDRVVKGCYVKCNIGVNNGLPVYRLVEIREVCETGITYNFDGINTSKRLKLAHGKDEKVFNMSYISNQEFTDSEFSKWIQTCTSQGESLPIMDHIKRKEIDIEDAMFEISSESTFLVPKPVALKSSYGKPLLTKPKY